MVGSGQCLRQTQVEESNPLMVVFFSKSPSHRPPPSTIVKTDKTHAHTKKTPLWCASQLVTEHLSFTPRSLSLSYCLRIFLRTNSPDSPFSLRSAVSAYRYYRETKEEEKRYNNGYKGIGSSATGVHSVRLAHTNSPPVQPSTPPPPLFPPPFQKTFIRYRPSSLNPHTHPP